MNKKSRLKTTLYSLIAIFVFLLVYFLAPYPMAIKRTFFPLAAILGFIFFLLGIALIFFAQKEKRKLKLFLMLTGISAIAPLFFSVLHNLFYGLAATFKNFKYLFEALHVAFFIISIIIAPIIFIVGTIGSVVLFKDKTAKKETVLK